MKKIILFAAATAILAACTSDDLATDAQQQTAQDEAVTFDAYLLRTTTRAGATGPVTTDSLKTATSASYLGHHYQAGFGVFAYYTDNFDYSPLYLPNFMYNEQVTWDGSAFTYPVTKYWPNEHGSEAASADQDRVSFFAYLPYVEVDPATGMVINSSTSAPYDPSETEVQWGITGMKRNSLQGDPLIQYIASFDQDESVDLCWGTVGADDVTWKTNSASQTVAKGYPWLNVRKPDGAGTADAAKVKFAFQHATAKLLVDVMTDNTTGWKSTDDATETKVWIRSVRFTGMTQKAALNLNNPKTVAANKARWISYYGSTELEMGESVTVFDGRKDGSEGVDGAVAPNEAVLGINPQLIQDDKQLTAVPAWLASGETGYRSGVPYSAVSGGDAYNAAAKLFCKGDDAADGPIFVIPTGERVDVEIVYDVETIDPKLPTFLSDGKTHGSTIENRIKKENVFTKLENGKGYTMHLILGMKDVKVDADVTVWDDPASTADVELPKNTD